MSPRSALLALGFAACATASPPAPEGPPRSPAPAAPAPATSSRYFQVPPEEAFVVTHGSDFDRLVVAGARLEVAPTGEVLRAAWDLEVWRQGDAIVGTLAVAPHLGGGFVHWSRTHVYRSTEFLGALEPIGLGANALPYGIRGARNGLTSVLVITEQGAKELVPGQKRLQAASGPPLFDAAALDAKRSLRVDIFGRATVTNDGGKTWRDLTSQIGMPLRQIAVGPDDLYVDTNQGRSTIDFSGKVGEPDYAAQYGYRGGYDRSGGFQITWKNLRQSDEAGGYYRGTTGLQAALGAGVVLADGTALGSYQGTIARVDLKTGKNASLSPDGMPQGLECTPTRVDDGVLYGCAWQRYQGYGGYALVAQAGEPPIVERAFSDDGGFVGDDDGALGFLGSCRTTARAVSYDDPSQYQYQPEDYNREPEIKPIFCVRRGPGDWVEHTIDLDGKGSLFAWVPRRDGSAVALVLMNDPLPERSKRLALPGARTRVSVEGGVRVVRIYRDLEGWVWSRNAQAYMGGGVVALEKRFRARDDGSVDGWIGQTADPYAYSPVQAGVTIDRDGNVVVHDLPPSLAGLSTSGDYGVALTTKGIVYDSLDHGRTWREAGPSPLPGAPSGASCSVLGCSTQGLARVGWGPTKTVVTIHDAPLPPSEDAPPRPLVACKTTGLPEPLTTTPAPPPGGGRIAVNTAWGDVVEILRDASVPEPLPVSPYPGYPGYYPGGMSPPTPSASATTSASAGKPKKTAPAAPVLKTHTLVFRPPLEPRAPVRHLNATDANLTIQRRSSAVPLLGDKGVGLLIYGDASELLVERDKVTRLDPFDARRYYYGDFGTGTGLTLPSGRALVFGDARRRTSIEEHGPGQSPPPVSLGVDGDAMRRRPVALARRDDGTVGVIVVDATGDAVGAAALDRTSQTMGEVERLARWSALLPADDPACRAPQKGAWRALVVLDPSSFLELDGASLPGVTLGRQGLLQVLWSQDRICLEAADLATTDARGRAGGNRTLALVMRFDGKRGEPNAALRAPQLRQDLACTLTSRSGAK